MAKVVLSVNVVEGDTGCLAEVRALDVGVGMPVFTMALSALTTLVENHCRVLVKRGGTDSTTADQLELARQIVKNGFQFNVLKPQRRKPPI